MLAHRDGSPGNVNALLPGLMDKRYLIVAGAFLVQGVVIGAVFSYGVYFTELEAEFGWSRTLLSAATSLAFMSMGLMATFAGQANDRVGPRRVITVAALCTGLAYVLLCFLSSPWQLFVIYGTLVAVGLATHDVVTLSTIARWFPRRRGLMSGVVKVGTACGQMLVPLLVVFLISTVGWRQSFLVLGISAGMLMLVAAWLMGVTPVENVLQQHQQSRDGSTFATARKNSSLWILCAIQFLAFSSLTTMPTHIVPHALDSGMLPAAAASLLTVIAFSSIAGRLLVGTTVDRAGGVKAYSVCLALLFASLLFLLFIMQAQMKEPRWLYIFCLVYGFAHGGVFTVVSPIVAEFFGMREHGKIFGLVVFFGTLGSVMPVLTGRVFDVYGSYFPAFCLLAVMALTAMVLSVILLRRQSFSG